MEMLKIAGFSMLAAILYGILHDQVTAHLCVEYFTIGHPPVFSTESPFLLAIGWGILATWWVGLALGLLLAGAARIGGWTRLTIGELRRPILWLMLASAVASAGSGGIGALLAANGLPPPGGWGVSLPAGRHVAFSAAAWAHGASYAVGIIGGLSLAWSAIRRRRALSL